MAVIAQYDVPDGKVFRFEKFGVDWDDGDGYLTWSVKINGVALHSYGSFKYQAGALSDLEMCQVGINVKGPAAVTIECSNSDTSAAHRVYARIKGGLVEDQ